MTLIIPLDAGIGLLSGTYFSYHKPEECEVEIDDIATALSNVCRFSGHLPQFYSVAQHAVNCSRIVSKKYAFTALMHDTAEAFTNDLPTPLKYALPVFKELEVKIESAMSKRFGFIYPLPSEVKLADSQMLGLEKIYIKKDFAEWSVLNGIDFDHLVDEVDLSPWTPKKAKKKFLARLKELTQNKE